jgi:hypothetical protein
VNERWLSLQHPATHDAWRWFHERKATLERTRRDHIDRTLRELSSLLWALDREAGAVSK